MDDLDELLGIDPNDPVQRLANDLTANDLDLIAGLVKIREAKGLTRAEVADRMGTTPHAVGELESASADPRLSTLRRYAIAIGASVEHHVTEQNSEDQT